MRGVEEIKQDIRLIIRLAFQPSFIEMSSVKGLVGDELFRLDDSGVIFWHRVSEDGFRALFELIFEQEIGMRPAHPMVYDNAILELPPYPLTDNFGPHDEIRWMPVIFCKKSMKGYERTHN
jgi:hypothetical protein